MLCWKDCLGMQTSSAVCLDLVCAVEGAPAVLETCLPDVWFHAAGQCLKLL